MFNQSTLMDDRTSPSYQYKVHYHWKAPMYALDHEQIDEAAKTAVVDCLEPTDSAETLHPFLEET
jgi:hypothetical protein